MAWAIVYNGSFVASHASTLAPDVANCGIYVWVEFESLKIFALWINNRTFSPNRGRRSEEYVNDRILLFKLQSTEKISKIAAVMFTPCACATCVLYFVFLSFMVGQYFGSLMGSLYAGTE